VSNALIVSGLYITMDKTAFKNVLKTLWTGDADLRLYITTVQNG